MSTSSAVLVLHKDGSTVRYVGTVRYAAIFAKKYGTLVRYVFFVIVRVRHIGTVRRFRKGTGTVRWYALLIKNPRLFAHYAGLLYAEAKKTLKPTLSV